MPLGIHPVIDDALLAFWTNREAAAAANPDYLDAVARSNGHLNQVTAALAEVCREAGAVDVRYTQRNPGLSLPGYYRPTKEWDVVVWNGGEPVAAIELKAQVGPSFGNNSNNRAEESIGTAYDWWKAAEANPQPRLWTGFAFVIEDCPKSNRPVRSASYLPIDPVFARASYTDRVRILTTRLQEDRWYTKCWAAATTRPPQYDWRDLDPGIAWDGFCESLTKHLRTIFD